MPPPSLLRGRCGGSESGSDSLSVDTCGSCASVTLAMVEPTMTDGSLLISAPNSPSRSCVEADIHSAVFSTNTSFAGGNSKTAVSATATAVSAGPGRSTEAADPSDFTSGAPATAAATTVVVNVMPAIIGYFSSFFGSGICAFYSRIFQAKGFSPYEIGILISANPLLNMTLLPVLSYLADKFRCQTAMLFVCIVIATVSMFGYTISDRRVPTISWFLVMTASRVSLSPLLDQRILMMFPKQERSNAWSYVRSYAAYGWGIGSFVASLVFLYTVSWVAVTMQYLLGQIGLAYSMVVIKPYERTERVPVHFVEVLKVLRTNKRLMLFLFSSTMMGAGYSFIDNFLFLFLGELGGSEVLMGFTVVLTVSTEIPLFQMSARLHQTLTERQMMAIAMSVWSFRVVCYTILTNAWMVLLIEPLHGVTFAFMWLPSMQIVSRAFPPKLSSSATGLLFTLTSGVGPMIGNLIAGTLYASVGPRKMFLSAAVVMMTSLLLYQVLDSILERRGLPVLYEPDAGQAVATDLAVMEIMDHATTQQPRKETTSASAVEDENNGNRRRGATRTISTPRMQMEGPNGGRLKGQQNDVAENDLPP
ncbi:membrane transporter, putative [Leishmania panamensis]|uniref:Membrane transporter, putative n=1 Tax=Leishmania panamensis TaxID=5679 RepID=A0A088RZ46_LEIPA|nr:membrane transporter, putative [Leishmania panamensis]AIO01428.1 membrane transporter, putative [Leishmania panamensis]